MNSILLRPISKCLTGTVVLVALLHQAGCTRTGEVRERLRDLWAPAPKVRAEAAKALGDLRDGTAETSLVRALVDPDSRVRKNAAKALWRLHRDSGNVQLFEWTVLELSDLVRVFPDGKVRLTRTVQFRIDVSSRAVRSIYLFMPAADLRVKSATGTGGVRLRHKTDWDFPQPEVRVSGFRAAKPGEVRTVRLQAELSGLLFTAAGNSGSAALRYSPGFFNVPVRKYSLRFLLPQGAHFPAGCDKHFIVEVSRPDGSSVVRWEGGPLLRHEMRGLRFSAILPRGFLSEELHLPPEMQTAKDLWAALLVMLLLSVAEAVYLLWARNVFPSKWEWHVLAAASLWGMTAFFQPGLIEDNMSYYSYARSPVLDGDFNFYNEYFLLNSNRFYVYDVKEVPSPSGPALFWAPFIALGHLAALLLKFLGLGFTLNGYSLPYLFATGAGGLIYTYAGLLLSYELARKYCSRGAALGATLLIAFSTNFLLVFFVWTASSFQPSFFLFAAFLFYWDHSLGRRGLAGWLFLGLLGGLMVQVRYQNGLLLILPFLESLWLFWKGIQQREGEEVVLTILSGLLFLGACALAFSPQNVLFSSLRGRVMEDTYRVTQEGRFALSRLWRGLTGILWYGHARSYGGGLISGNPALLLAAVGLGLFFRKRKWLMLSLGAALLLQFAIVASYKNWYGRLLYVPNLYFVTCAPVFILGLAVFLDRVKARWRPAVAVFAVAGVCAIVWNFFNIYLQLAFKQVDPFPEQLPFLEGLHRLIFLPPTRFRNDFIELTSLSGHFLRDIGHGIAFQHPMSVLGAAFQWLLLVLAIVVTSWLLERLVFRSAKTMGRKRLRVGVAFGLAILVLADAAIWSCAKRTDRTFSYYRKDLVRKPTVPSVLWGDIWSYSSPGHVLKVSLNPKRQADRRSHLHLIGYLRNAEEVEQGVRVARVEVMGASGEIYSAELRAGEDIADLRCNRPESLGRINHRSPVKKEVYDWFVRDGSKYFYWSHAYLSHIRLPRPIRVRRIEIMYLQKQGELVLTGLRLLEPSRPWAERVWGKEIAAIRSRGKPAGAEEKNE